MEPSATIAIVATMVGIGIVKYGTARRAEHRAITVAQAEPPRPQEAAARAPEHGAVEAFAAATSSLPPIDEARAAAREIRDLHERRMARAQGAERVAFAAALRRDASLIRNMGRDYIQDGPNRPMLIYRMNLLLERTRSDGEPGLAIPKGLAPEVKAAADAILRLAVELKDGGGLGEREAYDVDAALDRYLPDAIRAYASIDASARAQEIMPDGGTPERSLIEQFRMIRARLEAITEGKAQQRNLALSEHERFLHARLADD